MLAGLLAEPIRRRAVAAMVLGAATLSEVIARTGDAGPSVVKALDRLARDGLVRVEGADVRLETAVFVEIARQKARPPTGSGEIETVGDQGGSAAGQQGERSGWPSDGFGGSAGALAGRPAGGAEQAAVLRAFFRDGRLTALPTMRKKRLVVLDLLARRFEPGQLYSEAHVNLILGLVHTDTAVLRRALVDEDFLGRRDGFYWRTGGTVDVERGGLIEHTWG